MPGASGAEVKVCWSPQLLPFCYNPLYHLNIWSDQIYSAILSSQLHSQRSQITFRNLLQPNCQNKFGNYLAVSNECNVYPICFSLSLSLSLSGRLHRSWHVRSSRKARSRHPGGLRNGRGEDYAEGFGKEYVHQKVMEVRFWKKIKKKPVSECFLATTTPFISFINS